MYYLFPSNYMVSKLILFVKFILLRPFLLQVLTILIVVGSFGVKVAQSKNVRTLNKNIFNDVKYNALTCRKHSAFLTDFGAVGDGKTLNTKAFQAAIANLSQYANDGGAELIVPAGKWLTGSFNLTSHFTLFLHEDATILASQVPIFVLYLFLF